MRYVRSINTGLFFFVRMKKWDPKDQNTLFKKTKNISKKKKNYLKNIIIIKYIYIFIYII